MSQLYKTSSFLRFYVYCLIFYFMFKRNIGLWLIYQEDSNQKGKDKVNRMNIQGRKFSIRKEQVEVIVETQKFL